MGRYSIIGEIYTKIKDIYRPITGTKGFPFVGHPVGAIPVDNLPIHKAYYDYILSLSSRQSTVAEFLATELATRRRAETEATFLITTYLAGGSSVSSLTVLKIYQVNYEGQTSFAFDLFNVLAADRYGPFYSASCYITDGIFGSSFYGAIRTKDLVFVPQTLTSPGDIISYVLNNWSVLTASINEDIVDQSGSVVARLNGRVPKTVLCAIANGAFTCTSAVDLQLDNSNIYTGNFQLHDASSINGLVFMKANSLSYTIQNFDYIVTDSTVLSSLIIPASNQVISVYSGVAESTGKNFSIKGLGYDVSSSDYYYNLMVSGFADRSKVNLLTSLIPFRLHNFLRSAGIDVTTGDIILHKRSFNLSIEDTSLASFPLTTDIGDYFIIRVSKARIGTDITVKMDSDVWTNPLLGSPTYNTRVTVVRNTIEVGKTSTSPSVVFQIPLVIFFTGSGQTFVYSVMVAELSAVYTIGYTNGPSQPVIYDAVHTEHPTEKYPYSYTKIVPSNQIGVKSNSRIVTLGCASAVSHTALTIWTIIGSILLMHSSAQVPIPLGFYFDLYTDLTLLDDYYVAYESWGGVVWGYHSDYCVTNASGLIATPGGQGAVITP